MILFAEEAASTDYIGAALKLVQMGFYLCGAILVWLTYRAAKRGWLTPINTEYQKRVMDRLAKLSQDLYDETDSTSRRCWFKDFGAAYAVKEIWRQSREEHTVKVYPGHHWFEDPTKRPIYSRMTTQVRMIKSDPFVPEEIRDELVKVLEQRLDALKSTYLEISEQYIIKLATVDYLTEDEVDLFEMEGKIMATEIFHTLHTKNANPNWFAEEVAKIRQMMQDHFRKFDPHQPGGIRRAWYWICDHI